MRWVGWFAVLGIAMGANGAAAQTVGQAVDAAHGCTGTPGGIWALDRQLSRAQSCMFPDALVEISAGSGMSISSGTLPFTTPQTRDALYSARGSVSFNVNSAFRTLTQQFWLHTARHPRCGSVAVPGGSNHESGNAVDIDRYAAVRSPLQAAGCSWPNYTNDPWHFDCPPRGAARRTVLTFQRLWNLNHPEDRIAEDNSWGPQTESRLRQAPTAGFPLDGCTVPCDDTAGPLTFSCDGPNAGLACTSIDEPADPDSWSDNHLCTQPDLGFRWSSAGPLEGMNCVNVTEAADAHADAWADNYACLPPDAAYELAWSNAGPLEGWSCVGWNETADPGTWDDNFLCSRAVHCFTAAGFTFCNDGPRDGLVCESVAEPADPATWDDNVLCAESEVGLVWSATGPLDGMRCTQVDEPSDTYATEWSDNYLCVPDDAPFAFEWSSAGPIEGLECVRWYESSDLADTWDDNYLCVGPAPSRPETDGGTVSERDAGVDGGSRRPAVATDGCGCRTAGGGDAGWLGLLLLWAFRRRRD